MWVTNYGNTNKNYHHRIHLWICCNYSVQYWEDISSSYTFINLRFNGLRHKKCDRDHTRKEKKCDRVDIQIYISLHLVILVQYHTRSLVVLLLPLFLLFYKSTYVFGLFLGICDIKKNIMECSNKNVRFWISRDVGECDKKRSPPLSCSGARDTL